MYSEKVMDHFQHPRNVGEIPDADGVGVEGNARCGDIMKIWIKVENDRIVDVKFKTFGCAAAVATSSMITELVKGKTITEAEAITNRAVADALDGLPQIKMHCSNLAADALKRHSRLPVEETAGSAVGTRPATHITAASALW